MAAMVHSMDSLSAKWRDDPVRAALEKKKSREGQAAAREEAGRRATQLLERKLAQASKGVDARDTDQPSAINDDADYKKVIRSCSCSSISDGLRSTICWKAIAECLNSTRLISCNVAWLITLPPCFRRLLRANCGRCWRGIARN